jgi:AcrR family transcriptional regulator
VGRGEENGRVYRDLLRKYSKRAGMKTKKTKNQQSQETIGLILRETMKLFLEKGYHGTSINDIANATGLTKGALYFHFESKEHLLRRFMAEYEDRFLDGLIHSVSKVEGGAVDKLEKVTRYCAAFGYYNRELCVSFTKLAAELSGVSYGIRTEIKRIYGKYRDFLRKIIEQGKQEKVFGKEINPDIAALLIMAFHDGMLIQWSMNQDTLKGDNFTKNYRRILFDGILSS